MSSVKQAVIVAKALNIAIKKLDDLKSRKQTLQESLTKISADVEALQIEVDTQKAAFKSVAADLT